MLRIHHYGHLSIKFLDVMFGAVVALGFGQWFSVPERPMLSLAAFLFAHIILIDIWINYDPTVRKFPTKRPYMLILDLALIFSMAFLIHYSMLDLQKFLMSIVALRLIGVAWSERPLQEYKMKKSDTAYLKHTRGRNFFEAFAFALPLPFLSKIDAYTLVGIIFALWLMFRAYDHAKIKNMVRPEID